MEPGVTTQPGPAPASVGPLARLYDVLEAMPDAIVVVDGNGRMVMINSKVERMFGYRRAELLDQPVEALMPARFHGSHVQQRAEFFARNGTRPIGSDLELYGQRRNGTEFPVDISLSPIELDGRRLVAAAIRDISERRAAQQALRDQNLQLEAAMRTKDRFLATMNHELRTPLNAIIGFTGALLMKISGPLTAEQTSHLGTVQTNARHLLLLINDLLEVARTDSDRPVLHIERVDCEAVLVEVTAMLRPQAVAKGLALDCSVTPDAGCIQADRRALSQILINLVNNAIKYTEHGGVTVRLRRQPEPLPGHVVMDVADTGQGIQAHDLQRLFQPFSRIEGDTYRGEGTGLGLYLSRRLAESLGGTLACRSEFGRGSVFTLTLPVACQSRSS